MTRDVAKAREQAAHAIAVCACCPVRPDCLELSLRHAFGVSAHGYGETSRWLSTVATPGAAAAAALAAAASCSECTCP